MPSSLKPRKVLLAAYHFPPDGAVGALRPARFARALPAFGWEPTVLTAKDSSRDGGVDVERLAGLENLAIVKTRTLPSITALYVMLKTRLNHGGSGESSASESSATAAGRVHRSPLGDSLKRHAISLLFLLPDDKKWWSFVSALKAVALVRKHDIDCVLTSAPPASIHIVGFLTKALTRAKWIADFRDPWLESLDARPQSARSAASDAIERRMERSVVARADMVVTTTPRMRDALLARYGESVRHKVTCVPNGIDTERFHAAAPADKYPCFTITYAGSLYEGRTPEPLFQAVGQLLGSGRLSAEDVRIKFVGGCESIDGIDTRAVAARSGVDAVVEIIGALPRSEVIEMMRRSHLLLAISPEHHQLIAPAKLYDYLGAGSPILALAEPGATRDLVEETNSGRCFSHSDVEGIRNYLDTVIHDRAFATRVNPASAFREYDATVLTERLAAQMAALCVSTRATA